MIEKNNTASHDTNEDPRLAFVYQEAVRGITHQQGLVESMNLRAGNLIFATAFANSLLGGKALSDGLGIWDWLAMALLFTICALAAFMLWPYRKYNFRFDPEELLTTYVDAEPGSTLAEMHRRLALRIQTDMADNWRVIQRLRVAMQVGLVLLPLNILAWFLAVAGI
jgi:hypothetical protein